MPATHRLALVLCLGFGAASARADDATLLALQVSTTPRPSPELVALAGSMLDQAREVEPAVRDLSVALPWSPRRLMVTVTKGTDLEQALGPLGAKLGPHSLKPMFGGSLFFLEFDEDLAMPAVARLVLERPGVKAADLDSIIGGSLTVQLTREPPGYLLHFMVGSGDCPAGCIRQNTWDFRFDEAGRLADWKKGGTGERRSKEPEDGLGLGGGGGLDGPGFGGGLGIPRPPRSSPAPDLGVSFPAPGRPGR